MRVIRTEQTALTKCYVGWLVLLSIFTDELITVRHVDLAGFFRKSTPDSHNVCLNVKKGFGTILIPPKSGQGETAQKTVRTP
ncbi:hypothetical protein A0H81_13849 [Grifola frondosa]|uniref:Uncharacterized protein n=1 Tax=Grifola frondosa TaxID=5627 RepID=A0A1C7LN88_GRIFR|nr:hypothetical protein A0H81_13849 [Grifola frondosa]